MTPKMSDDDLKKQIKQDDSDAYGDQDYLPKDLDEQYERVTGNELKSDEELNIAKEVEKDENAIQDGGDQQEDPRTLEEFEELKQKEGL